MLSGLESSPCPAQAFYSHPPRRRVAPTQGPRAPSRVPVWMAVTGPMTPSVHPEAGGVPRGLEGAHSLVRRPPFQGRRRWRGGSTAFLFSQEGWRGGGGGGDGSQIQVHLVGCVSFQLRFERTGCWAKLFTRIISFYLLRALRDV